MVNDRTVASLGEFGLIEHCFKELGRTDVPGVSVGIGDDAAVLLVPRTQDLLATTDTLVEGVHFTSDTDPVTLGWKTLCVNLSDIAAMGGEPRWYLLSIALPSTTSLSWVEQLAQGMNEAGKQFRVTLVGGNTSRTSGPMVLTLNLFGVVGHERALMRSGANVGNRIYVSGTIGDSTLGLRHLQKTDQDTSNNIDVETQYLIKRHLRPDPRIALGMALVDAALARAVIDVSDGLLADLGHLCRASGVGADLDLEKIPLSAAARTWLGNGGQEKWKTLLTGGEDYELLFTVAPGATDQLPALAANLGLPLTEIGVISKQEGIRLYERGQPMVIQESGFRHF